MKNETLLDVLRYGRIFGLSTGSSAANVGRTLDTPLAWYTSPAGAVLGDLGKAWSCRENRSPPTSPLWPVVWSYKCLTFLFSDDVSAATLELAINLPPNRDQCFLFIADDRVIQVDGLCSSTTIADVVKLLLRHQIDAEIVVESETDGDQACWIEVEGGAALWTPLLIAQEQIKDLSSLRAAAEHSYFDCIRIGKHVPSRDRTISLSASIASLSCK